MITRIGITLGDITGVGPEVSLKALAAEWPRDDASYLILGDWACLERLNAPIGLPLEPWSDSDKQGRVAVLCPPGEPLRSDLAPGSPSAAQAALAWLEEGARRCLRQELAALVTAPLNKEAVIRSGVSFIGQTEFLSGLAGDAPTVMMLLGTDDRGRWLRVALATTHVPLKEVPDSLTREKVVLAIERAGRACADLGLARRRIGVCGLNPHAGEGGALGTEEKAVIAPAVEETRLRGIQAVGPLPADSLFHAAFRGDFDAVVAMYHDQGLAPLKMVAFEQGVNWTLGLPFIRTSPDHGTAYDIAGKNLANPSSMVAAIRLAKDLLKNQNPSAQT